MFFSTSLTWVFKNVFNWWSWFENREEVGFKMFYFIKDLSYLHKESLNYNFTIILRMFTCIINCCVILTHFGEDFDTLGVLGTVCVCISSNSTIHKWKELFPFCWQFGYSTSDARNYAFITIVYVVNEYSLLIVFWLIINLKNSSSVLLFCQRVLSSSEIFC